jgi:hypothetical protein
MTRAVKLSEADIAFLREVESFGPFVPSDFLPQRDYPNVRARNRCRIKGLVRYVPKAPRKGYWFITDAGRLALKDAGE